MKAALIALLLLLPAPALAQPAPSLAAAEALVRGLYSDAAPDASREAVQRLYAPELAQALLKAMDPASAEGLPFDMRYGDDNWQVRDLGFTATPTAQGCTVVARFNSFGKPVEIDWRLIRTAEGWRIQDVSAPAQNDAPAWSLGELLHDSNARHF